MKDATNKSYLLGVLGVILTFNLAEGNLLGILTQSIKKDLNLTDFDLGLLGGITFALFYATMGIPIARWADSGNRVTIIAVTTAVWGVAVSLCGAAQNVVQFMLIRILVGTGEAGALPTLNSLIPDCFGRAERSRAMAISLIPNSLSVVLGYGMAGWIDQLYGWRTAYVVLGLSGVPLAVLAALTLRDPRSSVAPAAGPRESMRPPHWGRTFMFLWRNVTFRHMALAYVVGVFFATGIAQWLPAFFMRSYGLKSGELGVWFAVISVVAGGAGTYLGGEMASRFAGDNEALQLKVMAALYAATGLLSFPMYLTHNLHVAFAIAGVYTFLAAMTSGPMFAIKQTIVPEHLRATSFAIVFLFASLIGTGFGPLIGGALSDLLHPLVGEESLRYALLTLSPGVFWMAYHLWVASRTVLSDLMTGTTDQGDPPDEQDGAVSTAPR